MQTIRLTYIILCMVASHLQNRDIYGMLLYSRIKDLREAKKISQAKMAESIGIATQNYWKIENGKTDLTISRLYEIANALDVPVIELLGLALPDVEGNEEHKRRNKDLDNRLKEKDQLLKLYEGTIKNLNDLLDHQRGLAQEQIDTLTYLTSRYEASFHLLLEEINKTFKIDLWELKESDIASIKKQDWFKSVIENYRLLLITLIGSGLLGQFNQLLITSFYEAMQPYQPEEEILLKPYWDSIRADQLANSISDFSKMFKNLKEPH